MCPNARHHRKDIISVNEDAVEFKKDNGSIHRFHIRSYNLMEQTITNFQNGDLSLNSYRNICERKISKKKI